MKQRYRVLVNGEPLGYYGVPITLELEPESDWVTVGKVEDLAEVMPPFQYTSGSISVTGDKVEPSSPPLDTREELRSFILAEWLTAREAEIAKLRAALEQYAKHSNWDARWVSDTAIRNCWKGIDSRDYNDGWSIAEEALK